MLSSRPTRRLRRLESNDVNTCTGPLAVERAAASIESMVRRGGSYNFALTMVIQASTTAGTVVGMPSKSAREVWSHRLSVPDRSCSHSD